MSFTSEQQKEIDRMVDIDKNILIELNKFINDRDDVHNYVQLLCISLMYAITIIAMGKADGHLCESPFLDKIKKDFDIIIHVLLKKRAEHELQNKQPEMELRA